MKKSKLLIIASLLSLLSIASCTPANPYDETYGYRIEENIDDVTPIDDNYRNYYEIFVRSFADSDGDGIGDLNGIIEKLDYIEDLGYTGIWLMPINPSQSYHKYDVDNYYEIDPDYGTIDDLKNLVSIAHDKGINVILDLVLNHSSLYTEEFKLASEAYNKYIKGETLNEDELRYYDYYSFFEGQDDPDAKGKTLYKHPTYNFYYEGNFSSSMPELNLDSQYVKEDIESIVKYYIDIGIDGFRLDAVLYYFINNTSKNVEFLNWFNSYVKSLDENAYIVGEAWTSDQVIKQYYESGIDSFFYFGGSTSNPNGFYLNSTNLDGKLANSYYEGLLDLIDTSSNGIPAPFLDNHDMSRYARVNSIEKTKFYYGLLSMSNGTTFTYYGDEVGMGGTIPPDQNVRTSIRWGEDDEKYDTVQLTGITAEVYPYGTVKENLENSNSILNYYKKANYLRNKFKSIARGEISLAEFDKDRGLLIITKSYLDEEINIAINFKERDNIILTSSDISDKEIVGQLIVDNSKYIGELNDGTIILPPYSIAILK